MESNQQLILIIGALNRSGTNFLAKILLLDNQIESPESIGEDYFLVYSNNLINYANETVKHWNKENRQPDNPETQRLMQGFGEVLYNNAKQRINPQKKLLLKTPRADSLENVFKLFPNAKIVLLIRDGRDTAESFKKSFPFYTWRQIIKLWGKGVTQIMDFYEKSKTSDFSAQVALFHYEDLINHDPQSIAKLCHFCDANPELINPTSIANIPLFGSSIVRGDKKKLHWEPVKIPKNFKPTQKWLKWSFAKKLLFKTLANKQLVRAKYENNGFW